MTSASEDMVSVLVPKKYVMSVYSYLSTLEQGNGDGEATVIGGSGTNVPDDNEDWSPRLLRLMYDQSSPAMMRILDHLADNPEREVPSSELVEVIGPHATSITLAGTLGAFGRRVANRYGTDGWPFDPYYSHEHGSIVYWMDGWVAEKVRSFRAS